jgi:hypothetical protein
MFASKGVLAIQPFLSALTSNCPMLTELILKDAVRSSHTLSAIGKSCHQLRILDITGSQVSCSDLVHLFLHSPVNVLVSMHLLTFLIQYLCDIYAMCKQPLLPTQMIPRFPYWTLNVENEAQATVLCPV